MILTRNIDLWFEHMRLNYKDKLIQADCMRACHTNCSILSGEISRSSLDATPPIKDLRSCETVKPGAMFPVISGTN